jgi:general secretion pathway protein J
MRSPRKRRNGFTLLELLVALAIFSLVAAMAGGAFWGITKAWNRGGELLEQLHYGEFAMGQLVTALRSAAWFSSKPEAFGFWLDDRGGTSDSAANKISWVTSGTAFLPPDSPYQNGLHRISVTVDSEGGERGLVVRAWPHVSEEVEETDVDGWLVSSEVKGLSCEWYDFEDDRWSQDWEETNSLPKLLRVTMTMKPRKEFDEELELQRLVVLEVAPDLPGQEKRDRTTAGRASAAEEEEAAKQEAAAAEAAKTEPVANEAGDVTIEGGDRGGGR